MVHLSMVVVILLGLYVLAGILTPGVVALVAPMSLLGTMDREWSRRDRNLPGRISISYLSTSEAYFRSISRPAGAGRMDRRISLSAAFAQAGDIAKARNLSPEQKLDLAKLMTQYVEMKLWSIFGASGVDVLKLNAAIDNMFGRPGV
jgi:K+-transporting ATPase c subunit